MCCPSASVMASCSESCCELLSEHRDGILWLSHHLILSLSFALWVSSAPCQRITFSYLGFPPGSYSATSALCHLCQVLLPTTSTLHQFVPVCPRSTSHFCVFFKDMKTEELKKKEEEKKHERGKKKIQFFSALSRTWPSSNSSAPH